MSEGKISPYVYPIMKLSFLNTRKHIYLPKSLRMDKEYVIEAIAEEYELSKDFPFKQVRKRNITEARQILCHICVFELQIRKIEVSRWLKQDHTTVLYACKKFDDLYKGCSKFKLRVDSIYKRLNLSL